MFLLSLKRNPSCGAALISDKHVLTAAHCFDDPSFKYAVLFHAHVMDQTKNSTDDPLTAKDIEGIDSWDIPNETDETEQSVRVDVESYINHPLYNNKTSSYDVALLTLKDRVSFADRRVLPICLPDIDELRKFEEGDTTFTVAGWGRQRDGQTKAHTRVLQKLDGVPYISNSNCELAGTPRTPTHMCAGFLEGGKDACQGDSGGPLMYNINANKNQYSVVGVVSASLIRDGVSCAGPGNPTMYTGMQEILQWVYHQTANTDAFWCGR